MVILNWSLVAFLLGMQKGVYFGMQSVRDTLVTEGIHALSSPFLSSLYIL